VNPLAEMAGPLRLGDRLPRGALGLGMSSIR